MRAHTLAPTALGVVLLLASPAFSAIIDHFDSGSVSLSISGTPPVNNGTTVAGATDLLGGWRTATLHKDSQFVPGTCSLLIESDPVHGFMSWEEGATQTGAVILNYNANGAGLGGVDLTDGGASGMFTFDYFTDAPQHPLGVTVILIDTSGNVSSMTQLLAGLTYPAHTASLLFSGLAAVTVNPANLASINSIELQFDSLAAGGANGGGGDYYVGNIGTDPVPEPATLALVTLGGIAALRRRKN